MFPSVPAALCTIHNQIIQLFVNPVSVMAFWISKTEPMLILCGTEMKMDMMWFLILYGLPIDFGIQLMILNDDSMSTYIASVKRWCYKCDLWTRIQHIYIYIYIYVCVCVWIILLSFNPLSICAWHYCQFKSCLCCFVHDIFLGVPSAHFLLFFIWP